MGRAWALAGAYAGSVIGAGFASGQELLRFFASFGSQGLWGMAVASLLFVLFGAIVFDRVHTLRTESHKMLLTKLCGEYLGSIVDVILSVFLTGSLGVMLAGSGVLLEQEYRVPFTVGVIVTALVTREIIRRDATVLLRMNSVLVVVLTGLTLGSLLPIVLSTPLPTSMHVTDVTMGIIPRNWLGGSVLYSSFNVALALSPLGALGSHIPNRRIGILAAVIGGGALMVIGYVILIAILQNLHQVAGYEMPILALLRMRVPGAAPIYSLVLYLALLTSCIAAAYGLGYRLAQRKKFQQTSAVSWIPFVGIPIAYLGFGNLVQTLYPIIGYTGLGVIALATFRMVWPR